MTEDHPTDPYRYDGNTLARAWLSVAQASGHKDDVPQLARTVHLEHFPEGLRIVATDRYILLCAWVPAFDDFDAEAPGMDVLPDRTVVAADPHGRAKNLMGYVLSLTGGEDTMPLPVEITHDVRLDGAEVDAPHFEGMDPTYVVLDVPDHETVYLPVIDAPFPDWRKLVDGFTPQATDAVALNPELLGRLGKIQKWTGTAPLVWRWGGPERVAEIEYPTPPLLFVDCETIHLEPFLGSMWEIAFMRLDDDRPQTFTFAPLISLANPESLEVSGYADRFDPDRATPRVEVADALAKALADKPALAGSAPWFDANHLAANFPDVAGKWHHHHLDVPTLVAGATYEGDPEPPWRLSQAARWADLDPGAYDRHTAAGDVLLARDLYRAWRTGA